MNKIWKLFQYGYIVIAIFFLIDAITSFTSDKGRAILSFIFAIFITLVFFFKRYFRKKVEKRNNQNK
ncbi:hypothetical protein [Polaribacter ponticola]|uniref:Uncharacterized protein n=1 Tax=Polaribacter ponticola TaxID=2978475 RepID=A0ABT5S6M9_9FLAO|nr:hypothetical protein [Polaribacter sp. MSW5]MDD7913489.1 hypothetical protein [Polaribacter sp. MSW5]